jgi:hypothetical protein
MTTLTPMIISRPKEGCAEIALPVLAILPTSHDSSPRTKVGSAEGAQPLQATKLPPLLGEGAGGVG